MEQTQKFPTEVIGLPSQGKFYSKDSPLSSGTVEMKYMTAKEEDILTNQNYMEKGIVIDKLLSSLLVDKKIDYNDILSGDKDALLLAARILGYGKDYEFEYKGEKHIIDLSKIENKPLHPDIEDKEENSFEFELPFSKVKLSFKFLTHRDEQKIEEELKGLKKINKDAAPLLSTRLKYIVTAVNGDPTEKAIREFVDTSFLARDSREFRKYLKEVQPGADLKFNPEDGPEGGVDIPIGISFLWPDLEI